MTKQTQINEWIPRIIALLCVLAMPVLALASTPELQVVTVPDEGEGPLEVKIVVRATNADPNPLFCKISTRGDDGPYDVSHFFTLEPPYAEKVFTYTYDPAMEDYTPTVRCADEGTTTVSSPVTVHNPSNNGTPVAQLEGPGQNLYASDPVNFAINAFDPDGESLNCSVDFDEFAVAPISLTIEPPYAEQVVSHKYGRPSVNGAGYDPTIRCADSAGAVAIDSVNTDVMMAPGNVPPTFNLTRMNSFSGEAPRDMRFRLRSINDPGSDMLSCYFDSKDGSGRQEFTIMPPYNDVYFEGYYTEPAEVTFPTVACVDGQGGHTSDNVFIAVHEAHGNIDPVVSIASSVSEGQVPLTVDFDLQFNDANGDTLNCVIDYGFGETPEELQVAPPYNGVSVQHTYVTENAFQASVDCKEDKGGHSRDAVWIDTDNWQPPANYDPIVRIDATPDGGLATLGVSFFVTGSDPDGDDITCIFDPGDGSWPKTRVLEAPLYTQEWVTHTYFTAAPTPYPARIDCSDGHGGESIKIVQVQVDRNEDNVEPVITQFTAGDASGMAPLPISFSFGADDVDNGVVACTLDYGDGTSGNWRMSVPLSVTPYHVYEAGTYEATLYCCDDINYGGTCGPDNIGVAVATLPVEAGALNQIPAMVVTPSTMQGIVPMRVNFELAPMDPDGDSLTCVVDAGKAESQTIMVHPPYEPVVVSRYFTQAGTYSVGFSCDDGNGALVTGGAEIHAMLPTGGGSRKQYRDPGDDRSSDPTDVLPKD